MSYCRTTLIEYRSAQDADELISSYRLTSVTDFPDAEILLCSRASPTSAVMTSLYPSKQLADRAMAPRKPIHKDARARAKIYSMEALEGDAASLP